MKYFIASLIVIASCSTSYAAKSKIIKGAAAETIGHALSLIDATSISSGEEGAEREDNLYLELSSGL